MQRDQRQQGCTLRTCSIIILNDPVKYRICGFQPHEITVPFGEYIPGSDPLTADHELITRLLCLPCFGKVHYSVREGNFPDGAACLGSFYDRLTIDTANALCDAHRGCFKIEVLPGKGEKLTAAAPGEDCQVKEKLKLQDTPLSVSVLIQARRFLLPIGAGTVRISVQNRILQGGQEGLGLFLGKEFDLLCCVLCCLDLHTLHRVTAEQVPADSLGEHTGEHGHPAADRSAR